MRLQIGARLFEGLARFSWGCREHHPDSFSDGGLVDPAPRRSETALAMDEGDLVDVGRKFTRPAPGAPPDEELGGGAGGGAAAEAGLPAANLGGHLQAGGGPGGARRWADLVKDVPGLAARAGGLVAARGAGGGDAHPRTPAEMASLAISGTSAEVAAELAAALARARAAGVAGARLGARPRSASPRREGPRLALLARLAELLTLGPHCWSAPRAKSSSARCREPVR